MDPIRPIVPHTSSLPIPPALAPESVKREQRRDADEQRRGGEPHEGDPEQEFELVDGDEDSPAEGGDDDGPPLHIDISV